jgi:hypothetical protein
MMMESKIAVPGLRTASTTPNSRRWKRLKIILAEESRIHRAATVVSNTAQRQEKEMKKPEYRWRKCGTRYREIGRAENYVFLRVKGCVPFCVTEKELAVDFYDTRKDSAVQLTTAPMQARKASTQTSRSCRNCGVRRCGARKILPECFCMDWQPRKASA